MKVYLLTAWGGRWYDDAWSQELKVFFDKEKAETEAARLRVDEPENSYGKINYEVKELDAE